MAALAEKNPTAIKAQREVDKRLICAICLDVFKEPKFLPCCHAFCKKCLQDHLAFVPRGYAVLRCPVCRSQFPVPEGGIAGFRTAFILNDLLEMREQLKKLSEAKTIACENCEEGETAGFCRQCGKFVCQKCAEAHRLLSKLFPGHEIAGLKEIISSVSQLIPVKQQPMIECPTHEKPLDIYCETCAMLVCHHCTIRKHKDHECDPITDNRVFQKHVQQIKKLIPSAKEKLAAVKEAALGLAKRSQEVLQSKERVRKEIEDQGKHLIADYTVAVQECVQKLTKELDEGTKEKLASLSSQREEAGTAATLLESFLDYVQEEMRIGSKQHILTDKKQIVDRIKLVTSQVRLESLTPVEEADFVFHADQQVATMPSKIGQVSFSTFARRCMVTGKGTTTAMVNQSTTFQLATKPLSTSVLHSIPISMVSCQLTPSSGSCPSDCDVVETSHGQYKVTYTTTVRGPHQLSVRVGGTEIPGSPFTVCVTPSPAMRGAPVRTITGLDRPYFVALSGSDKLVVTEWGRNCVTILDKHGKKIKSFGSYGSGDDQFKESTGITVTTDNHILVVDSNNARIKKFTMDGSFVTAIGSQGSGNCEFKSPENTVVHPSGKVLVADRGNHRIQLLNRNLSFCCSFGSRGSQAELLQSPYDMAIDSDNYIYIVDYPKHRIVKFTLQGEFVRQFEGEINSPRGIAIDGNNILYVTNEHFVSMFNLDGKFLGKFGKCGSGDAEFNYPYGVVVDKNGDLYVCDWWNQRIVVY